MESRYQFSELHSKESVKSNLKKLGLFFVSDTINLRGVWRVSLHGCNPELIPHGFFIGMWFDSTTLRTKKARKGFFGVPFSKTVTTVIAKRRGPFGRRRCGPHFVEEPRWPRHPDNPP